MFLQVLELYITYQILLFQMQLDLVKDTSIREAVEKAVQQAFANVSHSW